MACQTAGSVSEGSFGQPQSIWAVPYACTTYGVDPKQTEWQADRARMAFADLLEDHINVGPYFADIIQVVVSSMGTLTRASDAIQFPYWGQSDVLSLRLSR